MGRIYIRNKNWIWTDVKIEFVSPYNWIVFAGVTAGAEFHGLDFLTSGSAIEGLQTSSPIYFYDTKSLNLKWGTISYSRKIIDRNPSHKGTLTYSLSCRDDNPDTIYYKQYNLTFRVLKEDGTKLQEANCSIKNAIKNHFPDTYLISNADGYNSTWVNVYVRNCTKATGSWNNIGTTLTNFNLSCSLTDYADWNLNNQDITVDNRIFAVTSKRRIYAT